MSHTKFMKALKEFIDTKILYDIKFTDTEGKHTMSRQEERKGILIWSGEKVKDHAFKGSNPDVLLMFDGAPYNHFSNSSDFASYGSQQHEINFWKVSDLAKKFGYSVDHEINWAYGFYKE